LVSRIVTIDAVDQNRGSDCDLVVDFLAEAAKVVAGAPRESIKSEPQACRSLSTARAATLSQALPVPPSPSFLPEGAQPGARAFGFGSPFEVWSISGAIVFAE
jgi:hypothetical protein